MLQAGNKKRSFQTYLFKGGSTLEYQCARTQIINRFKSKDCFEFVERPANMVPNPGPDQVLLVENLFTEPEPTVAHEVDEPLATYINDIQAVHDQARDAILAAHLNAAEEAKLLLANTLKFAERKLSKLNKSKLSKKL